MADRLALPRLLPSPPPVKIPFLNQTHQQTRLYNPIHHLPRLQSFKTSFTFDITPSHNNPSTHKFGPVSADHVTSTVGSVGLITISLLKFIAATMGSQGYKYQVLCIVLL